MQQHILRRDNLANLIQTPYLNLYPDRRAQEPLEDIVALMRKNVTIQTVGTSTFQISFSYPEAVKAQAVVREFVSQFTTEDIKTPVRLTQHGNLGSYLEVLDPASLPQAPAAPNRSVITAAGIAFGLMLGALTLRLRPQKLADN